MRNTILFSAFLLILLAGCQKNKFSSTPSLKFKSVNTTELRTGQTLQFTLSFTDAEGDLTDSIWVEKIVPYCTLSSFSSYYALPSFPTSSNQEGDLIVSFGYNDSSHQNISPQCQKNDTAVFKFVLKDKAQHISDTVTSPAIILYY